MTVEIESKDGHRTAIVSGAFTERDRAMMQDHGVRSLEINEAKGFAEDNVDFLEHLPELESLVLLHSNISNIGAIHYLHELRELTVDTYCQTPIDFSRFPALRKCFLEWRPGSESVMAARSLEELYINGFPLHDLAAFELLPLVRSIKLGNGALTTLRGLDAFPSLLEFGLYGQRRLRSLQGIELISQELERLDLEKCKSIVSLAPISKLTRLRDLWFVDCGAIQSLAPVIGLRKLETVYFYESTKIDDGDLSPLLALPALRDVSFMNRRHYTHTREQVQASLGRERP